VYGEGEREGVMSIDTMTVIDHERESTSGSSARSRQAAATRELLLGAARTHFARDGYAGATVREIAADAGVNVALINRYFTSKEGLFEACISCAAHELSRSDRESSTLDEMVQRLIKQVADSPNGERQLLLLLLLRSSGEEQTDQIRRATLESFAQAMVKRAGSPGAVANESDVLRAQIALAAVLGVAMLRSSTGPELLTSASFAELQAPLGDLLKILLTPSS
jgi:AcrR family transcriptional regulator